MENEVTILIIEAMAVYFLVLWAHSLRHRFGPVHFYALIGGITAVMSWVTDAGVAIQVGGITFVVGSTVFYTSLLLGVFVVYVFDGPRATRIAISTIVGISAMVPIIAAILHMQMDFIGKARIAYVPLPSLRINTASVFATLIDLFFLAMVWEYLGKPNLNLKLWLRAFLTLLGVMWLDVLLFATGAFAGTPAYLSIMKGTLISRFIISVFAFPFLYFYLYWQNKKTGIEIENRPVLAILKQVAEIELELSHAQQEIERRKKAEKKLAEYQNNLKEIVKERTAELEDTNLRLLREVSERKQTEEALLQSKRELRIRNEINNIFLTHPDEEVYAEILKVILKLMESEYGIFGYFDEDGSFVAPAVSRKAYWEKCNMPEKEIIYQKGTFGGIWGRAIEERKTLISNDGPFKVPEGHIPILNTMVTPIIFRDEVISAIHIANKPDGYGEKDRIMLKTIADNIAPVLYARLQRDKLGQRAE